MYMKLISPAKLLIFALLASVASLVLAFVSEYGFGLKPCELCIFQRIPYALIIPLALFGLWKRKRAFAVCVAVALLFFIDAGIAAYHTGVEKHWIPGPEACTDSGSGGPMTLEQIKAKIMGAPLVACDQPQWEFHGVTMAMLNAFWAFGLAALMFCALHKYRKRTKEHA